jgi:glucose-6-phosphate dehydrogenase assembly protein OpcA
MTQIFDALPGIEVPVGAIAQGFSSLWKDTAARGEPAPAIEDATATQVNLVLHLGFNTTPADAVVQFDTAARFSRRYPSRVVILCPMRDDSGQGAEIHAKIYGECTLGKSRDDTRCCEFVLLSYARRQRQYLENQVSISISSDLPLYYWPHRFSENNALADYQYLLTRSKRVLIDSAVAPPGSLSYPWPRPDAVRDLAYSRLLHVRQAIGQFLSRYPMDALCSGLQEVIVGHGSAYGAEAVALLGWLRNRVSLCGQNRANFRTNGPDGAAPGACSVRFVYEVAKAFSWTADLANGQSVFDADYGSGRMTLSATTRLLAPEEALSDAMFF